METVYTFTVWRDDEAIASESSTDLAWLHRRAFYKALYANKGPEHLVSVAWSAPGLSAEQINAELEKLEVLTQTS
jgi:hypothetical protein